MTNNISPTPDYDRFGWYWQPAKWLEEMSPQDVTDAVTSSTHINQKQTAIKARTAHQISSFETQSETQRNILKQLD